MRKFAALLTALVIGPFALTGCGSSDSTAGSSKGAAGQAEVKTSAPASLNGTWKADGFEAVITDNNIEINIVGDDTSSLYWKGTFPAGGETVKSVADTEALAASLLGSQDSEKVFTIKDDQIDFEMSMMGTTQTVHLKK